MRLGEEGNEHSNLIYLNAFHCSSRAYSTPASSICLFLLSHDYHEEIYMCAVKFLVIRNWDFFHKHPH